MQPTDRLDPDLLWRIPRVGRPAANADGSTLVVPVTTATRDGAAVTALHRVGADGELTSLTPEGMSCTDPAVAPDGDRLAFVAEVDGRRQVHVLDDDGPRPVTTVPGGVDGSPVWFDADRLLVVTTVWTEDPSREATAAWIRAREQGPSVMATERRVHRVWDTWHPDDATQHVLLVDTAVDPAAPVDLTQGDWWLPDPLADPGRHLAVSPDRRTLAMTTAAAAGDDDGVPVPHLHVVPVAGGPIVDLTPSSPGRVGPPAYLPDGRIVVTIARERDFYAAAQDLWAIDPVTGDATTLLADVDHGLDDVSVAADGSIVIGTTLRGRGRVLGVDGGSATGMGGPHHGSLRQPLATTGPVVAIASSLTEPPELVEVTCGGTRRLTSVTAGLLDDVRLGEQDELVVTGADGDDVQVLLLHPPHGATEDDDRPPPLVHLVHGGPHAVFGDEWHWRWNAAVVAARGWVVAMVNFHGSTGVSHEFTRSIHGDWATRPAADVLWATERLVADGTVDDERIAIAGGSYGGYLVTWLCTQTDRFAAAVAHAAVTDVTGMWASDWTSSLPGMFGGRPWDDADVLAGSPSSRFDRLRTPMLVTHGERDLRVPIDQGRLLFGALQDQGVESRLVVFRDENHWVLDPASSVRWYDEVLGWLQRFLDAPM